MDANGVDAQLCRLIRQAHGSVEAFFESAKDKKSNDLSREKFKACLKKLGLELPDEARK